MRRDLIGETLLNQFRVESFIAAGGMATIYRVWDIQRSVPLAMKVLQPELAGDPAFMARFQREASSLQTLVHPHIVPFYGLYRAADLTFLLERYIDGPSLDEILRQRAGLPLPLRDVLVYFKGLYTSLGYAHNQGIIHCDVKPGNVLIDQGGHIYLTDFGIARYKDASTTTSSALGTPLYMAPEQVRGERVSPQTDIYSLGVLMFELLTGRRPFTGEGDIPAGVGTQVADRVRYQQLYTPAPDPRTINPSVPEGMAQVVMRAMDKNAQQRYASVQEMADAISRAVASRFESLPDRINLTEEWSPADRRDPNPMADEPAAPGVGVPTHASWPGPEDWREGQGWAPVPPPDTGNVSEYPRDVDNTLPAIPTGWAQDEQRSPWPGSSDPAPADYARERPARTQTFMSWFPWFMGLLLLCLCSAAGYGLLQMRNRGAAAGLPSLTPGAVIASATITATTRPGDPTPTPAPTSTAAPTSTQGQPTPTTEDSVALADFAVPGQIAMVRRQEGVDQIQLLDGGAQGGGPAAGGQAIPTVPNVSTAGVSAPAWSPDGQRLAWIASYNSRPHVVVMDMTEQEPYQLPSGEAYARLSSPAWLPDGTRVSYWASGGEGTFLVIADAVTGEQTDRLALNDYRNLFAWNPTNSLLAMVVRVSGVYQVAVSGSANSSDRSIEVNGQAYAPAWSRDGAWLAFQSDGGRNPGDDQIWINRVDGSDRRVVTAFPEGVWARAPSWSPDGQFIAFISNFSGSLRADYGELFVVDLNSGQVRQMTSTGGQVYDWRPAWR